MVAYSKFKADDNNKYKVEIIWNSVVYTSIYQEHLLELYYLVS